MPRPDPRLLDALVRLADAASGRPPLIGLSGAQGSGKSTLAAAARDLGAAVLSLDDVYLTAAARRDLAARVHPLLATRGPPGTHDLPLLERTLAALAAAGPGQATPLPAFDKLADDRLAPGLWPRFEGQPAFILIEGWCLGALPQPPQALAAPINAIERDDDPDGVWRRWVNDRLAGDYAALWRRFDDMLHLQAPDFAVVQGWREEQEAGLLGHPPSPARRAELARFIGHFERVTRHMMAGGRLPGPVAALAPDRRVLSLDWP